MTRIAKCAAGIGIGASILLVAAFAVLLHPGNRDAGSAPPAERPEPAQPPPIPAPVHPALLTSAASLPLGGAKIPDSLLEQLSAMVDLPDAAHRSPDKGQWARAMPIARKLLAGPCDCEQRNWLTRFVEMGNFAISDAGAQYTAYAGLMAHLGRNDDNAMALSRQAN